MCWAVNNAHFFHGISDHKDRFLSPVVKALHSCCTLSLWGDASGPHRFSHTHSRGLSKRNPVSFLRVSKKNSVSSIPNCLVWRHSKACSPLSWRSTTKTKQQNGARSDSFFLQRTKLNSTMTMKGIASTTLMWPTRSTPSESSQVRHRHAFIKVIMGQITTSVLRLMGRNGTVWCWPRCWSQTACPLCFIRSSKIHWPSSIAQKGSISKPCPLRLGPGPLSVGKVSVAFVQVHRTQTAARQGQAADLYSRLRQSMAAPAPTQQRFG